MNSKRKLLCLAIAVAMTGCVSTGEKKEVAQTAAPAPVMLAQSPSVVATATDETLSQPEAGSAEAPSTAAAESPPTAPENKTDLSAPPADLVPTAETVPPAAAPAPVVAPPAVVAPSPVQPKPAASAPAAQRPGPVTVVADRTPRTFQLVAGPKDASHPYFGRGSDMAFVTDGVQGKELVLTRGVTYTFSLNTGVMHDFYFTTSPVGRGAGTLTDGITGQFIFKGDATFTPSATTPEEVYYECRNHAYMGGKIHVVNAGEKVSLGAPPALPAAEAPIVRNYTAEQVKQKLSFADMLIGSSASAKRVAASNNAEAQALVTGAKEQLIAARTALAAGDNNQAMGSVDEALRMMNAATRLVPEQLAVDHKARYAALLEQVGGFEASYQKNLAQGMKPGKTGEELDKAKYGKLLSEAESLAGKGDHEGAAKRLESANELITAALSAMLHSQTMVYDKNFASPKDEYEFELSRYHSYAELVPVAIEQRRPAPQTVTMMNELTSRAAEVHDEALGLAAKGDHKMAVMAMQAATERIQKALRLAGVQ